MYTVGVGVLPDELKFLKGFRKQLTLIESSLLLYGQSFILIEGSLDSKLQSLFPDSQSIKTNLRWVMSNSMFPKWDTNLGLTNFERVISKEDKRAFPIERVCYFTLPNAMHETLPPTSPVQAALNSANILFALDTFAQKYIERGAIKATILRIDQTTPPKERAKIKEWWKDFMTGMKSAWSSEVLSNTIDPVVIGEGIKEVVDPTITRDKAGDIATTLGIPHSLLFSNSANFATSETDEKNLYTYGILPDAELIEEELNNKLFNPLGYNFNFSPQSLRVFQVNENDRANTFKIYVDSGVPRNIAVRIAGVELPDGLEPDDLMELPMINGEPIMQQLPTVGGNIANGINTPNENSNAIQPQIDGKFGQPTVTPNPINKSLEESERYGRWLGNRIAKDNWSVNDFKSEFLSTKEKLNILAKSIYIPFDNSPVVIEQDHSNCGSEKAMILQLNPDDDDEEQKILDKLESDLVKDLAKALAEQRAVVIAGNENNLNVAPENVNVGSLLNSENRLQQISGAKGSARDALRKALIEGVDLGVKTAIAQFETVGYGFNWTLANEQARVWAEEHSLQLVEGLDTVTIRQTKQAIAQWIANGQPLSDLINELETTFGQSRAELIASTEVTRSYAEANKISYINSGVVTKVQWRTAGPRNGRAGERTCPICGELSNKIADVNVGWPGVVGSGFPPAHPRCRCWIVPVIERGARNGIGSDSPVQPTNVILNEDDSQDGSQQINIGG
jgi:SPP1 gp7 family putative phage head morphogenesis protein